MKKVTIGVLAAVLGVLFACQSPTSTTEATTLSVTWTDAAARVIEPTTYPSVKDYDVLITAPGQPSQRKSQLPGHKVSFLDLAPGTWTIQVLGMDAAGKQVTGGKATATVSAGKSVEKAVALDFFSDGTGKGTASLNLTVSGGWAPITKAQIAWTYPDKTSHVVDVTATHGSSLTDVSSGLYKAHLTLTTATKTATRDVELSVVAGGTTSPGALAFVESDFSYTVAVTSVSLDPHYQTTMEAGATQSLVVTVLPQNASEKTLVWESSRVAVATVGQDGTVSAKAEGDVAITATSVDGNKSVVANIHVNAASVSADVGRGLDELRAGNYEAAFRVFQDAWAAAPSDDQAMVWSALGKISTALNDTQAASVLRDKLGVANYPSSAREFFSSGWLTGLLPSPEQTLRSQWFAAILAQANLSALPALGALAGPGASQIQGLTSIPDLQQRAQALVAVLQEKRAQGDLALANEALDALLAGPWGPDLDRALSRLTTISENTRVTLPNGQSLGLAELRLLVAQVQDLKSFVQYLDSLNLAATGSEFLTVRSAELRDASKQTFLESVANVEASLRDLAAELANPVSDYRNQLIAALRVDSEVFNNSIPLGQKILGNFQNQAARLAEAVSQDQAFAVDSRLLTLDFSNIDVLAFLAGYQTQAENLIALYPGSLWSRGMEFLAGSNVKASLPAQVALPPSS